VCTPPAATAVTFASHAAPAPASVMNATSISSRADHTCARKSDGTLACWGKNDSGQLGDGTKANNPTPTIVAKLANVTAVAAGGVHTCALLGDGSEVCWGNNQHAQLGDGTTTNRPAPTAVTNLKGATSIATGFHHSCAIRGSSAIVECWGDNHSGELGSGSNPFSMMPVAVSNLEGVTQIDAGMEHTCTITNSGVLCWGANGSGQLGDGTAIDSSSPLVVESLSNTVSLSLDGNTCAVVSGGTVECWGGDNYSLPTLMPNLAKVLEIGGGAQHSCALINGGSVVCWGDNFAYQLGNLDQSAQPPVPVANLTNVTAVAHGSWETYHTCVLLSDNGGTVACWGSNFFRELGNDNPENQAVPAVVANLKGMIAVASGSFHTCALKNDGTVSCWGAGPANSFWSATPATVPGISDAIAVVAGRDQDCALKSPGTVACWGDNTVGQLGNGTMTPSTTPVEVTGLTDAIALAAGTDFVCAVRAGLTASCWGNNISGQLGNGRNLISKTPVFSGDRLFGDWFD